MKRTVPLTRRTPLRARVAPARSSKPLPKESAKRRAERSDRDACRVVVLARDPLCRRCRERPAAHVHELKRRGQGGDYLDPRQCIGLCARCHDWVETHDAEAHAEGYRVWSYEPIPEVI